MRSLADRHDHAAGGRQHHEHVELGTVEPLSSQVAVGHEGAEDHRAADDHGDEDAEAVDADRAARRAERADAARVVSVVARDLDQPWTRAQTGATR